jgi:hypothetical protein
MNGGAPSSRLAATWSSVWLNSTILVTHRSLTRGQALEIS